MVSGPVLNAESICAPWATADEACTSCAVPAGRIDPKVLDDALWLASENLNNLLGGEWPGECTDKIRPVSRDCQRYWAQLYGALGGNFFTTPIEGRLVEQPMNTAFWSIGINASRHDQAFSHSSRWLSEIILPSRPVVSITEVKLDGLVLATDRYRVANRSTLVMTPQIGDKWQAWPCCQNDRLDDTEVGTFSVTYTHGTLPPRGGRIAAAYYACQLAISMTPKMEGCKLPERVTTITRQGVTMALIDPMSIIQQGMVGLPLVDTWVASVKARRKGRRATFTALDRRKPTRRDHPVAPPVI